MRLELEQAEIRLGARPLRLEQAEGWWIQCVRGTVWLTEAGEPQDRLLQPGDSYSLAGNGVVLLEALGDKEAGIHLHRPGRRRP